MYYNDFRYVKISKTYDNFTERTNYVVLNLSIINIPIWIITFLLKKQKDDHDIMNSVIEIHSIEV